MKRKVISIILIVIMVHSVYACGSIALEEADHDGINESVQEKEVSEETEDTLLNSEVQQAADEESAEPIYIIEPGLTQDDTYEVQDWQAAYVEYIESVKYAPYNKYALIHVDEDDIPELVICTGTVATACTVLTFHDGKVDALQTWSLQCNYIEKKNLYWDAGGHMGEFYDHVYTIKNGKWVHVEGGEYIAKLGEDGLITEEYDYSWEGEAVPEDEYYENLHAVYDIDKNQNVGSEQYEGLDEMLLRLQTEDNDMTRTHRYELYVEDITWDEAKRRCEERGGYLATITMIEEYEYIKKGIEDSGQTQIAYWVGNYYGQTAEEKIDETGIYLLYDDAKKDCYLYNAPMDMPLRNPEYTGKIGYICEYDSVTVMAKETFHTANGNVDYWHEYEYDSAGNRIKDTVYRIGDGNFWYRYEYEYDSAGNRTKEIHYTIDGRVDWGYKYEYDSVGNLTKEIRYNADSIECWNEYEYDSIGNLTKEIYYNADGSVGRWYEYEHDSAGNEIKTISYFGDGSFWYGYESEYDDVGNKTKNILYNADGSISGCEEWRWEYGYDNAGNRIKEIQRDFSGKIIGEYEYDSTGTLIKEIEYKYNDDFTIKEWEYDNMGNLTMSKHMEYMDGEVTDYSWHEYEYITITLHNEAAVSADE